MTNKEKQDLFNYICKYPDVEAKEIQIFYGCSISTIYKYKRIIKKRLEEKNNVNKQEQRR